MFMGFKIAEGTRKYFPCNTNGCNTCDKTEICERYKNESKTKKIDITTRLEGQKVLDEIEKYLY